MTIPTTSPARETDETAAPAADHTSGRIDASALTGTLTLRDGAHVHVRPIQADDSDRLRALHASLSPEAVVFRFFRALPQLPDAMARTFAHVDRENRMALVATRGSGSDETLLGVVRYDRTGPEEAEVAFVVTDAWQGRGIATALLHLLAAYARSRGFAHFVAITMGSNTRMLAALRHSGFPCTMRYVSGEVEARLDITREPATSTSAFSISAPASEEPTPTQSR